MQQVIHGDCLEQLKTLEDNSVDSVVTDPPYGLSREPDIEEVLTKWMAGEDYEHRGGGFMGNWKKKTKQSRPASAGSFFMPFLFALIERNVNNLKAQVEWGN